MSSEISFRSSFCCSVSSFGTNLADTLRRFNFSVRMDWAEPVLISTSATRPFSRTWLITSSFRLVDGLPKRGSLYTDARPSLKHLNHWFIWIGLKASFPNACWIFRIVSTWASPSFWQNLMQYLCLMRSVIEMKFAEKSKNRRTRATRLHYMLYRERNEWWIGSKRFAITHECVYVQQRFCTGNSLIPCWLERKRSDTFWTDLVWIEDAWQPYKKKVYFWLKIFASGAKDSKFAALKLACVSRFNTSLNHFV